MLRFIHITDTHVGSLPEFKLRGVETLTALNRLIDHLLALPFQPDFYLHTGDIVEDRSEAAYAIAKTAFAKLPRPVHYVVGNHDHSERMQRVLLGIDNPTPRYDYQFTANGIQFAVFDTHHDTLDPNGMLLPAQIAALRKICTPDGPPLVLITHHQPVALDTYWLDNGAPRWGEQYFMKIGNSDEFVEALRPARNRIRGVFFGHVHRSFQVMHEGILYASAASVAVQFRSFAPDADALHCDDLPGYSTVTIDDQSTIIRQYAVAR